MNTLREVWRNGYIGGSRRKIHETGWLKPVFYRDGDVLYDDYNYDGTSLNGIEVISPSRQVAIHFHSDGSYSRSGFQLDRCGNCKVKG